MSVEKNAAAFTLPGAHSIQGRDEEVRLDGVVLRVQSFSYYLPSVTERENETAELGGFF